MHSLQHSQMWFLTWRKQVGVFEHPDQSNDVETVVALKIIESFRQYCYIVKIPSSGTRNRSTTCATFKRQNTCTMRTGFTKKARDRPAPGAYLENITGKLFREWP